MSIPLLRVRRTSRLSLAIDWLLALTPALLIIFALPWSIEALEFNKALLFLMLIVIIGIVWVARVVMERTFQRGAGPFGKLLGLLAVVLTITWAFGVNRYTGLVGITGFYSHPLTVLLAGLLYAYLWTQASSRAAVWALKGAFAAVCLVALYMVLKLFGWNALPWTIATGPAFTPLTSSAGVLAMFASLSVVLGLSLLRGESRRLLQITFIVGVAINAWLLVMLDHFLGWLTLLAGVFFILITWLRSEKKLSPKFALVSGLIGAAAVILWVVPSSGVSRIAPPVDVLLDGETSHQLTAAALRDEPIFGMGPESFGQVFTSYRAKSFNDSPLWNLRFLKPNTEVSTMLVSFGVVGTLVWLAFAALLAMIIGRAVWKGAIGSEHRWIGTVFVMWLVTSLTAFFYPWGAVITIFWFFLVGLLLLGLAQWSGQPSVRVSESRQTYSVLGFAIAIVLAATSIFLGGRLWLAEKAFTDARTKITDAENITEVRSLLERAIALNGREVKYHFTLIQADLVQTQLELQKETPDQAKAQELIQGALDRMVVAVAVAPNTPDTYEQIGDLYQLIEQLSGSQFRAAQLDALNRAAQVETNNPTHYLRAGQLMLFEAQALSNPVEGETEDAAKTREEQRLVALDRADTFFQHALTLKTTFPAADLGLALVLDRRGQRAEAITGMENIVRRTPSEADTWLALGSLYLQEERLDDAVIAFTAVSTLQPGSPAGFFNLGNVFELQGKKTEAIAAYEAVDKLVPNNATVQEKLENLRK